MTEAESKELAKYREFVRTLSAKSDGRIFLNSDPQHAVIVFEQIFDQSQEIMRIFAGNLTRTVGNDPAYITALSDFVERGGTIKILLNNYNEDLARKSNLYKRLAYYKSMGKDIVVKKTTAKPYRTSDAEQKEIHFTVGDRKAYRIETNIESRTAECSMDSPEIASITADFFDQLFDREDSVEIDLLRLFEYDE